MANLPITTRDSSLTDDTIRDAIVRQVLEEMRAVNADMEKYRNYYEGEQALEYGTESFKNEYGDAFKNFRDNWCEVVVDAVADKVTVERIVFNVEDEDGEGSSSAGDTPLTNPLSDRIWSIFRRNDIDEQQTLVHQGALVESRSAVIVWPDPQLGARIDWQPGNLVYVRYADDDWRYPVLAVKRWQAANGDIYVNVYTRDFLYKYREQTQTSHPARGSSQVELLTPPTGPSSGLQMREIPDEPWPLPNPMGVVPVVEFNNKNGSELKNVVPQQDAVNYTIILGMLSAEHAGNPQRVLFTAAKEPIGGYANTPGQVWTIPPTTDAEGKIHEGKAFEFNTADLGQFRQWVEMLLQHMALTSKTPMRMFFHSDRGGRGDAPSGDSLLVSDDALMEKIEDRQKRWGSSWVKVAELVGIATGAFDSSSAPMGETHWQDPRARYRTALIEEAVKLAGIGIPLEFIIHRLGLTVDEVEALTMLLEQKRAEEEQQRQEQMAMQERNQQRDAEAQNQPASPVSSNEG